MTSPDSTFARAWLARSPLLFALVFAAIPARASEGGLVLLPDFMVTLPVLLVAFVVVQVIADEPPNPMVAGVALKP